MAEKEMSEKKGGLSLSTLRSNPWMVSTIVLGVLFLVALFFATSSSVGNSTVSQQEVGQKVLTLLNAQTGGGVTLGDVVQEGSLYKVTVNYQGDSVPVYATTDGSKLAFEVIPLDGSQPSANPTPVPSNQPVNIDVSKIADAPVKGSASAPVTLIEFSDYQCPFCERAYSDALKQVDQEYVQSGKVKIVYMDFPLSFHPEAEPAARVARCFEKVKNGNDAEYFKYHNKLFENQGSLNTANYKQWARDLGANGPAFDTCFDGNEFAQEIQADVAYGSSIGITGTPGFFVMGSDGQATLIEGAQPFSSFKAAIDAELAA